MHNSTFPSSSSALNIWTSIALAALGYFVDVYDLVLFSVVRIQSLKALGFSDDLLLSAGLRLLNLQMAGMLVGWKGFRFLGTVTKLTIVNN